MIKALFGFREHLGKVSKKKHKVLSDYILGVELDLYEEQIFPDTIEISKSTGLTKQKVRALIQDLYKEMLGYFTDHTFVLKESIQIIYIHFPYDEEHTIHKNYREEAKQMALWFQVKLPTIPRLGETINLDFIENDIKYGHGTVVEIGHDISSDLQRTIIHVHPLKNYFHQWDKLRVKHEREGISRSAS